MKVFLFLICLAFSVSSFAQTQGNLTLKKVFNYWAYMEFDVDYSDEPLKYVGTRTQIENNLYGVLCNYHQFSDCTTTYTIRDDSCRENVVFSIKLIAPDGEMVETFSTFCHMDGNDAIYFLFLQDDPQSFFLELAMFVATQAVIQVSSSGEVILLDSISGNGANEAYNYLFRQYDTPTYF